MKIAVITEDGNTISQHFGMAPLYAVLTIENGKVAGKETRPKMGHQHFAPGEAHEHHHSHGQPHGCDVNSHTKHTTMAQPISDCSILIAGGMGRGAYNSLESFSVQPIITDIRNIDEAVKLYLENKLPNLMERLH